MFIFSGAFLFAAEETSSSLTKQRIEVMELKKELNNFYNEKEKEYQQRKKELEGILSQIEKERNQTQKLHDKNLEILKDIKQEVESKTSKIYNGMKPKIAAEYLVNNGLVDFVGSDIHSMRYFDSLKSFMQTGKLNEVFEKNQIKNSFI